MKDKPVRFQPEMEGWAVYVIDDRDKFIWKMPYFSSPLIIHSTKTDAIRAYDRACDDHGRYHRLRRRGKAKLVRVRYVPAL